MNDILSVRLDAQLAKIINNFVQDKKMEKSEVVRQLILKGIYMNAVQDYLQQKISLSKAANMANMALSEFMDFLGFFCVMSWGGELKAAN